MKKLILPAILLSLASTSCWCAEPAPSILRQMRERLEIGAEASKAMQHLDTLSGMVEFYDLYGRNGRRYSGYQLKNLTLHERPIKFTQELAALQRSTARLYSLLGGYEKSYEVPSVRLMNELYAPSSYRVRTKSASLDDSIKQINEMWERFLEYPWIADNGQRKHALYEEIQKAAYEIAQNLNTGNSIDLTRPANRSRIWDSRRYEATLGWEMFRLREWGKPSQIRKDAIAQAEKKQEKMKFQATLQRQRLVHEILGP